MMVIVERRGRKRRTTSRYANGHVREQKAPSPAVIAARMPHRGAVDQDDCVSHMAECELGRLHLNRKISKGQYDAGVKFATVVAKYRATLSGPRPVLVGGRGYDCAGGIDCPDCECNRRKIAYDGAYRALIVAGQKAAKAVRIVAIQDQPCPRAWVVPGTPKVPTAGGPLGWGLSALRQHFDMEDEGKPRPTRSWVSA